jgi:hypothetical protein
MTEETAPIEQTQTFDSRSLTADFTQQLFEQAERDICFFGPRLDPYLFEQQTVIQRISEIARRHPKTLIRFLIHDGRAIAQHNPRLLSLIQSLSSKIKVHQCSKQDAKKSFQFLLAVNSGYLYCPIAEHYKGRVAFHDPLEVKNFRANFEDMWAESTPDINSRRLYI